MNHDINHDTAQRVIADLTALPDYDADEVCKIVSGIGGPLFMELDSRPGQFDGGYVKGDWHWKLRRARNNAANFFDVIKENA